MRRFVLYRSQDVSNMAETGIIAFGCEMWQRGPVALIWTVEPYNQTWLINLDGLVVHKHSQVQDGMAARSAEVIFLDEATDSFLEHLKHQIGSINHFPASDLQMAFQSIAGVSLFHNLPAPELLISHPG